MSVPPLRLYNNFETFFSGEVIIHASAVVAPGVIMQAAPNSKIIIGSGVCIGMGSILQVDTGTLEIESGANLGAGFLMVGAGKIGAHACVGSATTVFCASVEPGQVIPPGSVVGDTSRTFGESSSKEMNGRVHQLQLPVAEELEETVEPEEPEEPEEVVELEEPEKSEQSIEPEESQQQQQEDREPEQEKEKTISNDSASDPPNYTTPPVTPSPRPYFSPSPISYFSRVEESTEEVISSDISSGDSAEESEESANANSNGVGNHIYGRSNIKSLLVTLFPHRQNLDAPPEDESEEG